MSAGSSWAEKGVRPEGPEDLRPEPGSKTWQELTRLRAFPVCVTERGWSVRDVSWAGALEKDLEGEDGSRGFRKDAVSVADGEKLRGKQRERTGTGTHG